MTGKRQSAMVDSFGPGIPRRKPNLTPMIDVVFLLVVFFMLATRFGVESALPVLVPSGGGGAAWQGPPRLVEVTPETIRLNGIETDAARLAVALGALMTGPEDPVILRPREGASLARVVAVLEGLNDAGINVVWLAE